MTIFSKLPFNLRNRICIDSIILLRNKSGWYEINKTIKESKLYLKRTNHIYSNYMTYGCIYRIIFHVSKTKTFTWFKNVVHHFTMNQIIILIIRQTYTHLIIELMSKHESKYLYTKQYKFMTTLLIHLYMIFTNIVFYFCLQLVTKLIFILTLTNV